jgi:hypothetical protein
MSSMAIDPTTGLPKSAGVMPVPGAIPTAPINLNATNAFNQFLNRTQASLLTPAQMAQYSMAQANAQIAGSMAGINAGAYAQQAMEAQRALGAQGYAQALANAQRPDAATIADQYRQSAQFLQGLGTGLTGSVQAAQQQEANQTAQRLAAVGAPQIPGTPGVNFDPAQVRSALQYADVVQPSTSLAGQATNEYALAAARGAAGVANVGYQGQLALNNVAQAQLQANIQKYQLLAQRPEIYQQALAGYRSNQLQLLASLTQGIGMAALYNRNLAQGGYYTARGNALTQGAGTNQAKITGIGPNGQILPGFYPQTNPKTGAIQPSAIPKGWSYNWQTGKLYRTPATMPASQTPLAVSATTERQINQQTAANAKLQSAYQTKVSPLMGKFYSPKPNQSWQSAYNKLISSYPKSLQNDPRVKTAVSSQLTGWGYAPPTAAHAKTPTPAALMNSPTLDAAIDRMQKQGFHPAQIAGQVHKWHPQLTPAQTAQLLVR